MAFHTIILPEISGTPQEEPEQIKLPRLWFSQRRLIQVSR